LAVTGFEGKRKKHPEVVSVVLMNCICFWAVNLIVYLSGLHWTPFPFMTVYWRILMQLSIWDTCSCALCSDLCVVTTYSKNHFWSNLKFHGVSAVCYAVQLDNWKLQQL